MGQDGGSARLSHTERTPDPLAGGLAQFRLGDDSNSDISGVDDIYDKYLDSMKYNSIDNYVSNFLLTCCKTPGC
eukprot:1805892-Amphidinium_carterae.1